MAARVHIAFLWHMHQPSYRDPLTGVYSLPWVRLHAVKSYYDMPRCAEAFPELGMTFNLVPSLVVQLLDYATGQGEDVLLAQSAKPASELELEERRNVLANFFMCNWDTMVRPYPGYWNLLTKRGLRLNEAAIDEAMGRFSVQDFLDLQVWFNLCWFGFTALAEDEGLRELKAKGRLFSEEDKAYVLAAQQRVISQIIPVYRRLLETGQVELSTSPFYHPILPLLIDTDIARRPMPQAQLPPRFSHPEDAASQIERAVGFYKELFGRPPRGMWPSEGSVCPELIPLVTGQGLSWLATDEAILFNSLSGTVDRRTLYEPYLVGEGNGVSMVFRDRALSDLVSFTYGRDPAHDSAGDLYQRLKQIRDHYAGAREPLVCIILDGENPWEYYFDGGQSFLSGIFKRIRDDKSMEAFSIASYLEKFPAEKKVDHLYSGSWINHNFEIWIGGVEENRGWTLLGEAREFLAQREDGGAPPEKAAQAREELFAAEGSDWFWWYGDQFSSDNDVEFDRLFRLHLANVYTLLEAPIPEELGLPIIIQHKVRPVWEPIGFIEPVLDGLETNFYEWKEAGLFRARGGQAAMYRSERYVGDLYYGFNLHNLYLRLDLATEREELPEGLEVHVEVEVAERRYRAEFPLLFQAEGQGYVLYRLEEGKEPEEVLRSGQVHAQRIVEIALPFHDLGAAEDQELRLHVELRRASMLCERIPRIGYISLRVPSQDFERIMWSV
jgi:alpha-amylase/alpha-mannosidase (GH57 family)